jgi:hypothetical protein
MQLSCKKIPGFFTYSTLLFSALGITSATTGQDYFLLTTVTMPQKRTENELSRNILDHRPAYFV